MRNFICMILITVIVFGGLTGCATAEFVISPLSISPSQVVAGEPIVAEMNVSNIGGADGTYSANLTVDGEVAEEKSVAIVAGATATISFTYNLEDAGSHVFSLGGITETIIALRPAEFEIGSLSIPSEVIEGEAITVEAEASNTGEVSGIYKAQLTVNGVSAEERDIEIAPGTTEAISFSLPEEPSGTCTIGLGELEETLYVLDPTELVMNAYGAMEEAKNYQAEIEMNLKASAEQEPELAEIKMQMDMEIAVNEEGEQSKTIVNIILQQAGGFSEEIDVETYLIEGTMFVKTDASGESAGWQYTEATPDLWDEMVNANTQMSMPEDFWEDAEVDFVGTEDLNGVDCYILEVIPSPETFTKAIFSQLGMSGVGGAGYEDFETIIMSALLIKSMDMSMQEWIAKDGHYLKRSELSLGLDWLPLMEMMIEINADFHNPNMPVVIELPSEALSATPVEPESPVPSEQIAFEDDFSNIKTGWSMGDYPTYEFKYKDGEYYVLNKEKDWTVWSVNTNAGEFSDFTLEIDVRIESGPVDADHGLLFRYKDGDNHYIFIIDGDSGYHVEKFVNGLYEELHPWTWSSFIKPGDSVNHLKVICQGSKIEIYANDNKLTTVQDDSIETGYMGVIVGTWENDNSLIAFDNIKVYSIPTQQESLAAETELNNVQSAVVALMIDNELSELPNPVTVATNDMSAFPDTSVCEVDKIRGPTSTSLVDRPPERNPYIHGEDKDGYVLYQHDLVADGKSTDLVKYVTIQYTMGTYTVDMYGTVTQVTTGFE